MIIGFESATGTNLGIEIILESASVRRELGAGVRLFALAGISSLGGWDDGLGELPQKAAHDRVVGVFRGPDGREFECPKGTVTGVQYLTRYGGQGGVDGPAERIRFSMDGGVESEADRQSISRPRWRVLRGANVQAIAAKCDAAATLDGSVSQMLARVRIGAPPDSDAMVIQAGVPDREFLRRLLNHAQWSQKRVPVWLPLVHTGMIDDEGKCAWTVQSVSKRAHVNGRTFEPRRVRSEVMSGQLFTSMGRRSAASAPEGEREVACVTHQWAGRRYDADAWKRWRREVLPMFAGGAESAAVVSSIQDDFAFTGRDANIGWNTTIETIPEKVAQLHFSAPVPPHGWIGEGIVRERDTRRPWLTVELPGFESADDGNLLRTRLVTPYGGTDGNGGMNLVPEVGTSIALCWSGIVGAPVLAHGNVRSEVARLPAPSWHIESPWEMYANSGHIHAIGELAVESDLTVTVTRRAVHTAVQGMELEGNGGKLELKSGKVRTGRA